MYNIRIITRQTEWKRFWELFIPNTFTFSFWLATASFCFFVYQSLLPSSKGAGVNFAERIMPYVFLYFGYFCLATIVYLIATWVSGIRFPRKIANKELLKELKEAHKLLDLRLEKLDKQIREAENEQSNRPKQQPYL